VVKAIPVLLALGIAAPRLQAVEFGGMVLGKHPPGALRQIISSGNLTWVRTTEPVRPGIPVDIQTVVYPGATAKRLRIAGGITEMKYPTDLWKVYEAARTQFKGNRPEITAWEIGNEPDFIFSRDLPDLTASATKAAWFGLRDAGVRGRILMPSMAFRPGPYAGQLVANDIASYTDGWNFHFYGWAQDFDGNIREHRRLMSENGLNLPLWITEAGFAELTGDGSSASDIQLQRQAAYIERLVIDAWMNDVAGFGAFILSPYHADGIDYGLTGPNFAPRPALNRYLSLARELPRHRPLYRLRDRKTGESLGAVVRRDDGLWWTILWTPRRRAENDLPPPKNGAPSDAAPETSFYPVRFHPRSETKIGTTHETPKLIGLSGTADFTLSAGTNLHLVSRPGKFPIDEIEWVPWKSPSAPRPPAAPQPVVVQIRPASGIVPDRDGLCYRFESGNPLSLEIVAYNFSADRVAGVLRVNTPGDWKFDGSSSVKLSVEGRSSITNRITLRPARPMHSQGRYTLGAAWETRGRRGTKASVLLAPHRTESEPFEAVTWNPRWHADPPGASWDAEYLDDGTLRLALNAAPTGDLPGVVAALPDEFVPKATDSLHVVLRHHEGVQPTGVRAELVTEDRIVTFSNRTSAVTPEGWRGDFRFGDFEAAFWSRADPERTWNPSRIRYVRLQFGEIMAGTVIDVVSVEIRRASTTP
jgi:hypothetical protein